MENQKIKEIKIKYNAILARYNKAEKYLEDTSVPIEKRLQYIGFEEDPSNPKKLFNQVVREMGLIVKEFELEAGYCMTTHEIFNGFKL